MFIFKDNQVINHTEAFPTTCFPANVTFDDIKALDASIKPVSAFVEHNRDTHKLVTCNPTERDGVVYIMEAVELSAEEIQAMTESRATKIKSEISNAVQARLDAFASERNYDSILSACTYASSAVAQFTQEGQLCVDLRDATWGKLYQIMQEVETGKRPMPVGYADIESELPELVWA
jgi:hypothetical protein